MGARMSIADDHPDLLESMALALSLQGVAVRTARDGLEAVGRPGRCRPISCCWTSGCPGWTAAGPAGGTGMDQGGGG
jgi:hypothetical protein